MHVVRYDVDRGRTVGRPLPLPEVPWTHSNQTAMAAQFDVSENGSLVYLPARSSNERKLIWVDRDGAVEPLSDRTGLPRVLRISPGGEWVAGVGQDGELQLIPTGQGPVRRLVRDERVTSPVWAPDGEAIYYVQGGRNLKRLALADTESPELVHRAEQLVWLGSVSPDGRRLAFMRADPVSSGADIMAVRLDGSGVVEPVVDTDSYSKGIEFRPGGGLLAYQSMKEGGGFEIYVRTVDSGGGEARVSVDGGEEPVWSKDGSELYFLTTDRASLLVAEVGQSPADVAPPRKLLDLPPDLHRGGQLDYDVAPGGRFLMVQWAAPQIWEFAVVLNWQSELERLLRDASL